MRKVTAAINMTLDGYCDHTAVNANDELHEHYAALLGQAGVLLYGRKTFELMQFWQTLLTKPSGERAMDDFAIAIDKVPKIVFSHTLQTTGWESARLSDQPLEQEVRELKQQSGKDIFVGSRSLIVQLMDRQLIDELQICVHPVVAGEGLPLFSGIERRATLELLKTQTLGSGEVVFFYGLVQN